MSDGTTDLTPAPATESTPPAESSPSTADIARTVMDRAETPVETAPAPDPTPAPELSPAAKFLLEQGHKAKKEDGRDVWLPVKTIEGMLDRYVTTHKSTWDTEKTTLAQERDKFKTEYETMVRNLQSQDPRDVLKAAAQYDRRYEAFLQQQAQPAPTPASDMPQPDVELPDGSRTYSLDGIRKLMEWNTAVVEAKMDARLKPWTEREQLEQARVQAEQASEARARQQLAEAETWPHFGKYDPANLNDVQKAILEAMAADKKLSLHGAYIRVMGERFSTDHNKVREKVLAELEKAPKGTSVPRTGAEVVRQPGPLTTADIARRVIERGA